METNFENCHRLSQLLWYTLVLLLFLLYILRCLLFHIYTHHQLLGINMYCHPLATKTRAHSHYSVVGWWLRPRGRKKFSTKILSSTRYALGFSAYNRSVPKSRSNCSNTRIGLQCFHRGKVLNVKAVSLSFYSR